MELREICISEIEPNPAQPAIRITPNALKGLKSSIASKGLLDPITVREKPVPVNGIKYTAIDGHRRTECCRELGKEKIYAIILNGEIEDISDMRAFRDMGEFNRRISALEYLDVYLAGGEVPANLNRVLAFIIDKLERKAIRQLRNQSISPHSVLRVHPLYRKLNLANVSFKQYWNWIVKHRMIRTMNVMDKLNYSEKRTQRLKECIENDKPFSID